jgi:hypothetical protein
MFEKIWRSLVKWFRKSFGIKREMAAIEALPPLDDVDREYLFMQLLEGVAHGWQQPRAIGFFNKIRHRVRKSDWLEWLDRFGSNLLDSPAPNYELAGRMVQLGQLDCGDIGDKAGEYGSRLLNFHQEELPMDLLPIIEFDSPMGDYLDDDDSFDDEEPMETGYLGASMDNNQTRAYGEELLIDAPMMPEYSRSSQIEPAEDPAMETREITLEEFAEMLAKDPTLVAELAAQFGVETTDPQVIVNAVMAQMQTQQEMEPSSDLTPEPPSTTPAPTTDLSPEPPSTTPTPPPAPTNRQHPAPPPPPSRKLEYNPDEDDPLAPRSPNGGV